MDPFGTLSAVRRRGHATYVRWAVVPPPDTDPSAYREDTMHIDYPSLPPLVWRVLVAAAVVGLRLGLDELVPRGHIAGRARSRTSGRR